VTSRAFCYQLNIDCIAVNTRRRRPRICVLFQNRREVSRHGREECEATKPRDNNTRLPPTGNHLLPSPRLASAVQTINMKPTTTVLLALVAKAISAPTTQLVCPVLTLTASLLITRRDGSPKNATKTTHLYICTDAGFKGACTNLEVKLGECCTSIVFSPQFSNRRLILIDGVGDAWNDKISSVGPDKGTFCAAYP
jgi:hypothetical protein